MARVDTESRQEICGALNLKKLKIAWKIVDIVAAMEITKHLKKLTLLDPFLHVGRWGMGDTGQNEERTVNCVQGQ